MPFLQLFKTQYTDYRVPVLPRTPTKLAVEAAASLGWHRWVGPDGDVIAHDRFGASDPYERVFKEFGFTAEHVANRALALLGRPPIPAEPESVPAAGATKPSEGHS